MNSANASAPFEPVRKLVETVIVHSPFGRLLGVAAQEIAVDRVRLRLPFANDVVTLGDLVHGGAIAGLCDVAATAACWANPGIAPGSRGTTISLLLSYLNGARGQDLVADARVLQRGRTISVAEIDVRGADGTLVARATATYKLDAPRAQRSPHDVADASGEARS